MPSLICFLFAVFLIASCTELEKPKPEPFYSEAVPTQKREFRWSNGKLPKSFDPARAAAPPETDVVRAVYEGLTDTNPQNLKTIPSIAVDWSPSDDYKTWTFILRRDAKWSNGETVTANDFARSWKRLATLGEQVAHQQLLNNIVGMRVQESEELSEESKQVSVISPQPLNRDLPQIFEKPKSSTNAAPGAPPTLPKITEDQSTAASKTKNKLRFGVEAVDEFTLKVSLVKADKNFPSLVANPIFRPVYGDGAGFESENLNVATITNGAFRIFSIGEDGITLDRSEIYWNNQQIKLERVKFVPTESAEKALEAYRAGEIDAVTNASFEPLALKLLSPYEDFQRTTHSALNFYEFNRAKAPYDDRRVREALAISIERERLTEDKMDGASRPALRFTPFEDDSKLSITQDEDKAKKLLTSAGFPSGANFPIVRLIINRNDMQQRIAKSVAKMWKEKLNIETEIIIKESSEIVEVKKTGDFDLIRRGVVLATTDEAANMATIFQPKPPELQSNGKRSENEIPKITKPFEENQTAGRTTLGRSLSETLKDQEIKTEKAEFAGNLDTIDTEAKAIFEFPAIPLYFPTSYSLVKPYILGFQMNTLDAPSLKNVSIDDDWQPKKTKNES